MRGPVLITGTEKWHKSKPPPSAHARTPSPLRAHTLNDSHPRFHYFHRIKAAAFLSTLFSDIANYNVSFLFLVALPRRVFVFCSATQRNGNIKKRLFNLLLHGAEQNKSNSIITKWNRGIFARFVFRYAGTRNAAIPVVSTLILIRM